MKTVFITGAGRDLGASISNRFLDSGYNVYGASRGGTSISIESHDRYKAGIIDITDPISCQNALADCLETFGEIDLLINNASSNLGGKSLGEYEDHEILSEIATTLSGTVCVTNALPKALKSYNANELFSRKRKVIFIASTSGILDEPGCGKWAVYAAAKAGIIRFSDCAGEDLASKNISTFALIPDRIRAQNFKEEQAISENDVLSVIEFIASENDNTLIKRMILRPSQ